MKKAACQIIGAVPSLLICVEKCPEGKYLNVIGVCLWEMELLFPSFIVNFLFVFFFCFVRFPNQYYLYKYKAIFKKF